MDRGAWRATVHLVAQGSHTTQQQQQLYLICVSTYIEASQRIFVLQTNYKYLLITTLTVILTCNVAIVEPSYTAEAESFF